MSGTGGEEAGTSSSGGRNNQNRRRNGNSNSQANKFKGSTSALNGHVFLTPAESKDPKLFERTMEEIKRYADITFATGASDLASLFAEELKDPVITKPEPLIAKLKEDEIEVKLWELEVKAYGRRR